MTIALVRQGAGTGLVAIADKQALLAYCVASSISVRLAGRTGSDSLGEYVVDALSIDWVGLWRPDAVFWQRLTKSAISALVLPVLDRRIASAGATN